MPLIPADLARTLAVSLDGRTLGSWVLGPGTSDDEVLVELGEHLLDGIARMVGPDEPLDPGSLSGPALPEDVAKAVQTVNDFGDLHVEGPGSRAVFFGAVDTLRAHWCTHAPRPQEANDTGRDEGYSDDSPTRAHAPESAEDPPAAAQPVESPHVSSPAPAPPIAESAEDPSAPPPAQVGEAERGRATDAAVRRWTRDHHLVELAARAAIPSWVRADYERLDGAAPDFRARALARRQGVPATTPNVHPDVATHDTVNVWCVRNGVEDKLPPTLDGRAAYRAAWELAHPEPPAGSPAAAGQDPPTPERAGRADRASGRSDAVEPIGDGTAEPDSPPEKLAKAADLAADGKTPRQIMAATGVWLREARAAVRKATQS